MQEHVERIKKKKERERDEKKTEGLFRNQSSYPQTKQEQNCKCKQ